MKKIFSIVMLLLLCVTQVGCSEEPSNTEADNTSSKSIVTVILNGYGKTVQIDDTDLISKIKATVNNIAFETTDSEINLETPGAISLTVTFEYQDGSQDNFTYPYCLRNGKILVADESSIKFFDEYFE